MSSKVEGLAQLQANMQKLARQQMPKATARAINTVARGAMRKATKKVAKQLAVPQKLIRPRAQLRQKATSATPVARIRVNRSNLPLIRLLESPGSKLWEGRGGIMVGKYGVQRGFKQTLKNGRTHIMQRQGKARYSIDVVKIPLTTPLTNAFHDELKNYPAQIQFELTKQLSQVFK